MNDLVKAIDALSNMSLEGGSDLFERTQNDESLIGVKKDFSDITVIVDKSPSSQMFLRHIVKPSLNEKTTMLVCKLNDVYLYITEDNKLILTTNGEIR